MKTALISVLYDDMNLPCKVGDNVFIETTQIKEMTPAKIVRIQTNVITFEFDDPLIGVAPIDIRVQNIIRCEKML